MPRFVVLRHETPPGYPRGPHYDLMFEQGEVLWTWALEALPQLGGPAIAAERLADHRLAYLDYEGEISGDRGRVVRVDHGLYSPLPAERDELCFGLEGSVLRGVFVLVPSGKGEPWQVRLQSP